MKTVVISAMLIIIDLQHLVNASPCDVMNITARQVPRELKVDFTLILKDEARCQKKDQSWEIHGVVSGSIFNSKAVIKVTNKTSSSIYIKKKGMFRLQWLNDTVIKNIISKDFRMPGNNINTAFQVLGKRSDMIHFHLPADEDDRIRYWVLEVSKFINGEKQWLENVTGNATDVMKENLSPEDCYFFRLWPKTRSKYELTYKAEAYTDALRCALIRRNVRECKLHLMQPFSSAMKRLLFFSVTATVIVVLSASIVIINRLSKRGRALLAEDESGRRRRRRACLRAQRTQLLVIHAREPECERHFDLTMRLLDELRRRCSGSVHDIWDDSDPSRLQDPNGWLQEVLSYTSDVKVLLIASPRVVSVMKAIISRGNQQGLIDLENGNAENGFLQMVASIRKLLDKDFFDNYDRVYVVRYSDLWDKDEEILSMVTGGRRFCLPEHGEKLFEELK
ncbi:uncharacterized protein LOC122245804 [Penaeus japonicus]|uniref:uncharacterized protein LOC122245804 n=1 Tax=Penaeus japonicus TaxID=27405 RepID=UPI001C70F0B2|nr:uncharacterized protein LOC122245804 [Penaeus japonicus]XP_042859743.1 uncharacterized protein LOC122245804 [Penaeus japonicus]XP_042859744.1 uncharacterized protein LOC122245804 [Penaeus japonicus]